SPRRLKDRCDRPRRLAPTRQLIGVKDGAVSKPRFQRELRLETQRVRFDAINAEHRRQSRGVVRIFLPGVNREQTLTLGQRPPRLAFLVGSPQSINRSRAQAIDLDCDPAGTRRIRRPANRELILRSRNSSCCRATCAKRATFERMQRGSNKGKKGKKGKKAWPEPDLALFAFCASSSHFAMKHDFYCDRSSPHCYGKGSDSRLSAPPSARRSTTT